MSDNRQQWGTGPYQTVSLTKTQEAFDEGLRSHMISVYNHMLIGLVITGMVAYLVSLNSALMQTLFLESQAVALCVIFSPFAFLGLFWVGLNKLGPQAARVLFYVYAAVMGLSLSFIFLVYTGASITRVFFITAATFAAMSLWGYTTKRDLTGLGHFMLMGLIGIIIASVVNIFILGSSALHFAISIIGVIVFTGLTAWDTQRIKESYINEWDHAGDAQAIAEFNQREAILGALNLYLNFINLFIMLLRLFGSRE